MKRSAGRIWERTARIIDVPHRMGEEGYQFSKAMENPGFIGIQDIQNTYLPMGFSNFKIEGRGLGSALILEFLLYYMTKPEYQIHVREKIYLDNMLDLFCIGFICGFVGAGGGGMMMLLILTSVLGYELKTAVGTSVFIMAFTAFTGAGVSHFVIGGKPDGLVFTLCVIFTLIWAELLRYLQIKPHRKHLTV